jgi:hypothetical protein
MRTTREGGRTGEVGGERRRWRGLEEEPIERIGEESSVHDDWLPAARVFNCGSSFYTVQSKELDGQDALMERSNGPRALIAVRPPMGGIYYIS